METADVLIVGGGPAGSTCARALKAGGADVVVVDRARFPRDKPCAGWVTPQVLETLGLDVPDYVRRRTLQPFFGFRVGWIGGPSVVTEYGRPMSFGLRRWELDEYLLMRSGARLRECTQVNHFARDGDTWVADDKVRAPIVVGAGGQFCPVARHLNGRPAEASQSSLVLAQEVEFLMDGRQRSACRVLPEVPELYFSPDLEGYGWCVRKGDWLNVGLGRRREAGLTRQVADFRRWITAAGRVAGDAPSRWPGHAYRLYEQPAPRIVGDGMLLVGDAAGLATAASGEGIRPAVQSGLLAAEVILGARTNHRDDLLSYAMALEKWLGPRRPHRRLPLRLIRLGAPIFSSAWFARHVVLDHMFLAPGRPRRRRPWIMGVPVPVS
jgi:flavin-dependent dehydrogenase